MKKRHLVLCLFCAILLCLPIQGDAEKETFTLMIYLCGTDLETENGFSTEALLEMISANVSPQGPLTVVVETGGTRSWWIDEIDAGKNQRWRMVGEDMQLVDSLPRSSMGDPETLRDFIDFCMREYPSDRYGLILSNHGGGSTSGVCFDEFDEDYLSAPEIHDVLAQITQAYPPFRLTLFGVDACLMATFELASHVQPFADYMVASEELLPVEGFDYVTLFSTLEDNPAIDGQALGRVMVDSFFDKSLRNYPDDYLTMSVLDLAHMPALADAMDTIGEGLSQALEMGELATISRSRQRMRSFGDFSSTSSDMVDLRYFIEVYGELSGADVAQAQAALEDVVLYSRYTESNLENVCGLSILLPMSTRGDYGEYADAYDPLSLYPQYSTFLDGYIAQMNEGSYQIIAGMPSEQVDWPGMAGGTEPLFEAISHGRLWEIASSAHASPMGRFSGYRRTELSALARAYGVEVEALLAYLDMLDAAERQGRFGQDGYLAYSLTLNDCDMAYLSYAEGNLMIDISDGDRQAYIDLGYLRDTRIDWERDAIYSRFDGEWPTLEGQFVYMQDQSITDVSRRSLISAYVNGMDTYLLVVFDQDRPQGEVIGYTAGYNEMGAPIRGYAKLTPGDIIIPQYYVFAYEDDEEFIFPLLGETITYTGEPLMFEYTPLGGKGLSFAYAFCLADIFGEFTFSDFLFFSM